MVQSAGWRIEASGQIVPNVWISYPHNGARNRKVESLRGLNTDSGLGLVGMAKIFEHSLTAVRRKERTKRSVLTNTAEHN